MSTRTQPKYIPNYAGGRVFRRDLAMTDTRVGESNPGWRKKIEQGQNATTPLYSDRWFNVEAQPMHCSHKRLFMDALGNVLDQDIVVNEGFVLDIGQYSLDHLTGPSTADEAQALSRVYDKIRKESYGANGLLFLGELKETLHQLKHPLSAMQKGVSSYLGALKSVRANVKAGTRKRKSETDPFFVKRRLAAVKDAMSGTWLEFQFGVKPLISDVGDILDTALDIYTRPNRKERFRARSTETPAYALIVDGSIPTQLYTGMQCLINMHMVTRAGVQYVVGLKKQVSGPGSLMEETRTKMGFQIQNFVPTIYELIPYSFLVDYFVNLGDILEAACTDTSSVSWVSRTSRQDTYIFVNEGMAPYNESLPGYRNGGITQPDGSTRTIRHLTATRTLPALGLPPLVVSVPGTDSTKWFNMAALVAQAGRYRF